MAIQSVVALGLNISSFAAQSTAGSIPGPFAPHTGFWKPFPNGDFERNLPAITNATQYTGSQNFVLIAPDASHGRAVISNSAAYEGYFGATIKPGKFNSSAIALAFDGLIEVMPGHEYVLSAFVRRKHPDNSRASVYIDLWDGVALASCTSATSDWQFIYAKFNPSGHTTSARIVVDRVVSTNDVIDIDELSLTPSEYFIQPQTSLNLTHVAPGETFIMLGPFVPGSGRWNIVRDGDFETGPREIPFSPGWTGEDKLTFPNPNGKSGTAQISSEAACYGGYGAEIRPGTFKGAGVAITYNGIYCLKPGREYILSGFIKRPHSDNSRAHVYFDLWLQRNPLLVSSTNLTTEWQFVYGAFTASNDPVTARATIDSEVAETDVSYFDELAITPIEDFVPPTILRDYHPAEAETEMVNGSVTAIVLKKHGGGYSIPPSIEIEGNSVESATAVAIVVNGDIDRIIVTHAGSGYTSRPQVRIDSWPPLKRISSNKYKTFITPEILAGHRYAIRESEDLQYWTAVRASFLATRSSRLQVFEPRASARYYQIIELEQ